MNSDQRSDAAEPLPFEAIVGQTPDAIVFADRTGAIRVWNRGAEAVFGFSAAEVIGSLDVIIRATRPRTGKDSARSRDGHRWRRRRDRPQGRKRVYIDLSFALANGASLVIGAAAAGITARAIGRSDFERGC
jgi:PAS domain S-box-containing protein